MCETENRVCDKTLKFFRDVGEDCGSSAKTGSTPRLSRDVVSSTLNPSRTIGNTHTSALLVVWNFENVARVVGGWLLHSCGSFSISDDHDCSFRVWRCGIFSLSIYKYRILLLQKTHLLSLTLSSSSSSPPPCTFPLHPHFHPFSFSLIIFYKYFYGFIRLLLF